MKLLFITTPARTNVKHQFPPLGCLYLAAYIRDHGHTVKIIDEAKDRRGPDNPLLIQEISDFDPDLIAISGIITAYRFVINLTKALKTEFSDTPIVIGGFITLDNYENLFKNCPVDYCIIGFGEMKLLALIEHLEGKRDLKIPMLAYREEDHYIFNSGELFFKNIDEAPMPAYDLIDMDYYSKTAFNFTTGNQNDNALIEYLKRTGKTAPDGGRFPISGARGCTDKCLFCVHEIQGYRGFMVHSIEKVMENIKYLYQNYNIRFFYIGDDLFLYNAQQAENFVNAMNEACPDAYYSMITRSNFVNDRMMDALKKGNCFGLCFGFESGSPQILKTLKKGSTREQNINAYQKITNAGISLAVSFMVGTPGETTGTIRETISAIREAGINEGGVFYITPYPGSMLFRECIGKSMITDQHEYLLRVSDRNADLLSINLTKYPDIILKMMYVMVQNAFTRTKWVGMNRLVKSYLVPFAFQLISRQDRER